MKPSVTVPEGDLFTWANENPKPEYTPYIASANSTPVQQTFDFDHAVNTPPSALDVHKELNSLLD